MKMHFRDGMVYVLRNGKRGKETLVGHPVPPASAVQTLDSDKFRPVVRSEAEVVLDIVRKLKE